MGDLVLKGATSGQITVTPTGVAGTNTLTLPAKTGNIITSADSGTVTGTMLAASTVTQSNLASNVAGNGPMAFATMSGNQTISGSTLTKVNFDTATSYGTATNGWDATNKRFTPNVAGYYFVTGFIYNTGSTGWLNQSLAAIYKNGSADCRVFDTNGAAYGMPVNGLIYLNGSTDYIEIYVYSSGANLTISGSPSYVRCSLLRAG